MEDRISRRPLGWLVSVYITDSQITSSPAFADRPRDASCLSVVQYLDTSTVQYLERNLLLLVISTWDLQLRTIKFCSVLFGVVVHAGCDKQDSLMRGGLRGKGTSTLTVINNCTVDRRDCWSHSTSHRSESQKLVENRDFCLYPTCIRRPS